LTGFLTCNGEYESDRNGDETQGDPHQPSKNGMIEDVTLISVPEDTHKKQFGSRV
jgi:hypothetical protein